MRQKIAILLPDLRVGGAERLHLDLGREWHARGIEVEFVLRNARGELLDLLPPGITVADLGVGRVRDLLFPLARYLRRVRPDVLLAAMWPLSVVAPLAARLSGFNGRVVVSEHSPLSLAYGKRGSLHRHLLSASQRLFYPLANSRVAVSAGVADDLARNSGLQRSCFQVIHNPVTKSHSHGIAHSLPSVLSDVLGPVILSVGRLKQVKRHDLMVRAFAQLPENLGATLCIVGDGPERMAIEDLVVELGLHGRVVFPGYVAEPAPYYAHADLFVLASDYEGFGNVIVEALEHGLPVVSTNCPAGPHEILEEGRYGTLVPVGDVNALARAMDEALGVDHDRDLLRRRARDFGVDKAADAYLDVMLPDWRGDAGAVTAA